MCITGIRKTIYLTLFTLSIPNYTTKNNQKEKRKKREKQNRGESFLFKRLYLFSVFVSMFS